MNYRPAKSGHPVGDPGIYAAVEEFQLNEQQRKRLVIQEVLEPAHPG